MKENIIVSACLLGESCRYDGQSKPCEKVIELSEKYNLIPVCPEVMGGLKTPRHPSEIIGESVIGKDGSDNTKEYKKGAEIALSIALQNDAKKAVLKAKSPSCGKGRIYDGTFSGTLKEGDGITAKLFMENEIEVLTENEI
ncbi:MAG: DUF523 domain-containing protein [Clostridia bacterium]|nr:DUF523 domain-containing protein [Clostridia bacterium]